MNNKELNARLRKANPVSSDPNTPKPSAPALRRAGQILLAVLATLVVGAGVTWAATGKNPVASVFKQGLHVEESAVGLDSFSLLRPMTQEDLDALPRRIARTAHMRASVKTTMKNVQRGLPPFGYPKPTKEKPFRPDPSMISAIGHGHSNEGQEFTMLVIDDEICTFARGGFGLSNCAPVEDIEEGSLISASSDFGKNWHLTRIMGTFTDEVAAIKVDGSDSPPIPVPENVFELGGLEAVDITLIGLDADENELFRRLVPVSFYGSN